MKVYYNREERIAVEKAIMHQTLDFPATYMAVSSLEWLLKDTPQIAAIETVIAIKKVIESKVHTSQRQSYFLYRKAANVLLAIVTNGNDAIGDEALGTLKHIVKSAHGSSHRAAAEALGALSVDISGPTVYTPKKSPALVVSWNDIVACYKRIDPMVTSIHNCKMVGRSLVATSSTDKLLVIKLARSQDAFYDLNKEALWLNHLRKNETEFPVKFDIPTPLKINNQYVFRPKDLPLDTDWLTSDPFDILAIGFIASSEYFKYPNDHRIDHRIGEDAFKEALGRNAWLLGKLSSRGIIHTAPIPLFHNRVQRHRRADHGVYEWPRAGRLDKWLNSCRYPNIGISGLRDFEHLEAFQGSSRKFYRLMGNHLFALVLVCASYFRHRDINRMGFDKNGETVDTKDLFDRALFADLIDVIYQKYYEGFTGQTFKDKMPINIPQLVDCFVDEFGVDRYMEEVLRIADQQAMTPKEFKNFLKQRDLSLDKIEKLEKGKEDITLYTGPHLGGFNQRISLPELIHFTATATAFCICGLYQKKNSY